MPEPEGSVAAWSVPEVGQWLESLHFPPATVETFRENAVAGGDLLQLTDDDLESHLGLTPLLARKLRAELQKKGVSAPAASSAPAAAAADTTAAAVAAAVTAALKAAPLAAAAAAPAAAVPATSARSSFNPADLDRYAELQQKTREMQGLQIPSKLAAAQQHSASVQSQLAAARAAVQTTRAALSKEEKNVSYYKGGGGGCCGLCKGKSERKQGEAEAQAARLREQLQQQEGRASSLAAEADEAQRQLAAWQGQAAELEGAQRTMEGLVDRMFAAAGGRQAELADAARVLEGQAAEANRSADAFARGTQKLQNAAAALQEALAAMSRTQMLGAVNMGRGIGFQRRTGARARQMPGRPLGNVAEMAVFRRANDGVAQAARDVQEASALLGPGMPRIDARVLSTARAGMFANLLVGGTVASAVQLAAVRRSMDQVRSLLGEVQACLTWARQNLAAHQQNQAHLAGQASAKRAEVDAIRRQELQEAVAARTAAATA